MTEIKVLGTLDPKRHSQMDVHDVGGVMSCLDDINEKKKICVKIKEATKQGYAVARGGRTVSTSQCRNREQEEDESG